MSRVPTANANLLEARKIKQSGFLTKIHSMPEFKSWFDNQLSSGTNAKDAHALAVNKWGKKNIPSLPALYSYIRKYYSKEHSVNVIPYQSNVEDAKNYDALQKLRDAAETLGERHKLASSRENITKVLMHEITANFELYLKALSLVMDYEIKTGVRQAIPASPTLNNFGTMQMGQFTGDVETDLQTLDENTVIKLGEIEVFQRKVKANADKFAKGSKTVDPQTNEQQFEVVQRRPARVSE